MVKGLNILLDAAAGVAPSGQRSGHRRFDSGLFDYSSNADSSIKGVSNHNAKHRLFGIRFSAVCNMRPGSPTQTNSEVL